MVLSPLARALSRARERERESEFQRRREWQFLESTVCNPNVYSLSSGKGNEGNIREEERRFEGEGETRKREREIVELGVERAQEEEIVDW